MQKVLTAAQMREVDRLTTERYGIPSIILMENAAHAVARVITEKLGGSVKGKSILILCGKGNNGGDGAAIARILWTQAAKVSVLIWGSWQDSSGDARTNFEVLNALRTFTFLSIDSLEELSRHWQYFRSQEKFDVIVDAVFGTGLTRVLDEDYIGFLDIARDYTIDCYPSLVVAVDIPSGLDADGNDPQTCPLEANVTVTFEAPKPALVLPPAKTECGEVVIASIGIPSELISTSSSQLYLANENDCRNWFWESRFHDASYKNKRGHALMIAGSRDYSGAAVLCGDAAIRSGVGLVTLALPESSRDSVVARVSPEVMVRGVAETEKGSASEAAFDEITEFSENVDVIAVGSGLSSKEDETKRFIKRIVDERSTPIVIDADGLTALSPWHKEMKKPDRKGGLNAQRPDSALPDGRASSEEMPLILTPHEGEFRKLLGVEKEEAEEILKYRVQAVRDFATEHSVILVLKGERNLIGAPNGNVVVNPTGNPGLGKAGNGDTLTGIITGFVAQAVQMKIDIFETVVAAVYVAGMAGDIAEKKFGKRVMTASDTRECLVEVFAQFEASGSVDSGQF